MRTAKGADGNVRGKEPPDEVMRDGGSGRPPRPRKTAIGFGDEDESGNDARSSRLRSKHVQLIDEDGSQLGIVLTQIALKMARERGLELFLVQPDSSPPVARIMNYGRFKLENENKARETKRKNHHVDIKEINMRYQMSDEDYQMKLREAANYLRYGDGVKALIILRGREMQRKNEAVKLLEKFSQDLSGLANINRPPKTEGKSIIMMLFPLPVSEIT